MLLKSDFFGRLRLFKESISELFFAPTVTAAAIECNVRIGHVYVDLIDLQRREMDNASIQSKYGDLNDQTISDAAGQTLNLVDLLKEKAKDREAVEVEVEKQERGEEDGGESVPDAIAAPRPKVAKNQNSFLRRMLANAFSVNKWLLIVGLVLTAMSVGIYVWADFIVPEPVSSIGVRKVEFDTSILNDYIKTGRISGDALYVVLHPVWETMPKEKQQELMQKLYQMGPEKGFSSVILISSNGKMVGFVSATRHDLISP